MGNISKPYKTQGTRIINATTIGNNTVQQKDINWSKRILGKLALAQINVKIIRLDLVPNIILDIKPDIKLLEVVLDIEIEYDSHWIVSIDDSADSVLCVLKLIKIL